MRIAFFGLPIAALLLGDDGHDIVFCGISHRGALGVRRLILRLGAERAPVAPDPNDGNVFRQLRAARPELVVSWFWPKRIPRPVLDLAPSVGVHPSLLPRHRGADPYFWTLDSGDELTGVTAHLLEEQYDTGAILSQRKIDIDSAWDAWQLARALDRPSLALLREVTHAFAAGKPPPARAQDERFATEAPQPSEEDLSLRWAWSADRIARRVRAAAPWPGAWTQIGDHIVTLERVRPTRDFPRALLPGEAAVRPDGIAVVRAGDAALELLGGRGEDEAALLQSDLAVLVERARTLSIAPRARLRFDTVG